MIDRELIEKAESGSVDAIISLGFAYYDREDGEENRGKAFELYTKALEFDPNNARAINNLNCFKLNHPQLYLIITRSSKDDYQYFDYRSVSLPRSGSLSRRKMLSMFRLITSYSLTCFFSLP